MCCICTWDCYWAFKRMPQYGYILKVLNGISQSQKDKHCMIPLLLSSQKERKERWWLGPGGGRGIGTVLKWVQSFSFAGWRSSGDLLHREASTLLTCTLREVRARTYCVSQGLVKAHWGRRAPMAVWGSLTSLNGRNQHSTAKQLNSKKRLTGSVLHCLLTHTHTHEYCVRQAESCCTSETEMPLLCIFRTSTHLEQ